MLANKKLYQKFHHVFFVLKESDTLSGERTLSKVIGRLLYRVVTEMNKFAPKKGLF